MREAGAYSDYLPTREPRTVSAYAPEYSRMGRENSKCAYQA